MTVLGVELGGQLATHFTLTVVMANGTVVLHTHPVLVELALDPVKQQRRMLELVETLV